MLLCTLICIFVYSYHMAFKSFIAKPLAHFVTKSVIKTAQNATIDQQNLLLRLCQKARNTRFGQDHHFSSIHNHSDFAKAVPIRDYEQLKPYIEDAKQGLKDILWPGIPLYFAKTSGTTSGAKYIPITTESMPHHITAARNALFCYIARSNNHRFVDGNMIFLSGSPELEKTGTILTGRLSGIVNHHVPQYLRQNQLPTYNTNCIDDWETKLDAIVEETVHRDMRLISGIPPWMQMYFDRLNEKSGKKVGELFPNLSLIVHGGVNIEPYKAKLIESIGRPVDMIETFPASEGFIAYQDSREQEGLLLNTHAGLFFEFVPADEIFNEKPTRLALHEVKTGVNYALIISSNAGLWAYNIGDTIRFVSTEPYRIVVSGRIKHFISAFGEHVIGEEVEHALLSIANKYHIAITEFTVAPMIGDSEGMSYHEWFVEFETLPSHLSDFAVQVDEALRSKNIYYEDLRKGSILAPLRIRPLRKNAFINYMKSKGKLGGQNKVARLSNDRTIAEELKYYTE